MATERIVRTPEELRSIASQFDLGGRVLEVAPYGTGHINETYASRVETARGIRRFIHQRVNEYVFKNPGLVMENIQRVTGHLRRRIADAGGDPDRETLTLVRTVDGTSYCRHDDGTCWRTYLFIERAQTFDLVTDLNIAGEAARAFARFQRLVVDLPGGPLAETIPHFHDTPRRVERLREAAAADAFGRAAAVRAEIAFAEARAADASLLNDLHAAGRLPLRTTHNDTKFNNVMIDERTGKAICVIDLDTVMPGYSVHDFGECVRTGAATAPEDETDLGKVGVDLGMFEALARGFLEAGDGFLSPVEVDSLVHACRMMAYENGVRFLTDHLSGDVYFRIHRPGHNLDRCRAQFKLVEAIESSREKMEEIVRKYA